MATRKTLVDNPVDNDPIVVSGTPDPEAESGVVDLDINVPCYLQLDENKSEADQFEVVSVNGKNYQIARGVQVMVPYKVFEALYNSGRFKRL